MSKRTIVIVVLAAVGTAGALAYRNLHRAPDNQIRISGNIELAQVNIAFKISGKLIERAVTRRRGSCPMTVKITPNDKGNPPGKLAEAELHFTEGPLEGLKLIGFSI